MPVSLSDAPLSVLSEMYTIVSIDVEIIGLKSNRLQHPKRESRRKSVSLLSSFLFIDFITITIIIGTIVLKIIDITAHRYIDFIICNVSVRKKFVC